MAESPTQNGSQRSEAAARNPAAGTPETQGGDGNARAREQQQSARGESRERSRGTTGLALRRGGPLSTGLSRSPFASMMQLSRDMDRLMESLFGRSLGFSSDLGPFETARELAGESPMLWSPRIDVRERDDAIVIRADLPGVKREDVRVECTDDGIAISGERREEREERGERYQYAERSYGSFYRNIPLPDGAKAEEAKASMRDGVLEVTVPLQASQRRRQIQIEG
ncbi:MAG TPA: Hsp20/alpha crystallin family protein [Steroidobacteraceae bacterium]|nr:Hsp20/alpha crystallin family protein [Steroidobacteraceae bacterium]